MVVPLEDAVFTSKTSWEFVGEVIISGVTHVVFGTRPISLLQNVLVKASLVILLLITNSELEVTQMSSIQVNFNIDNLWISNQVNIIKYFNWRIPAHLWMLCFNSSTLSYIKTYTYIRICSKMHQPVLECICGWCNPVRKFHRAHCHGVEEHPNDLRIHRTFHRSVHVGPGKCNKYSGFEFEPLFYEDGLKRYCVVQSKLRILQCSIASAKYLLDFLNSWILFFETYENTAAVELIVRVVRNRVEMSEFRESPDGWPTWRIHEFSMTLSSVEKLDSNGQSQYGN